MRDLLGTSISVNGVKEAAEVFRQKGHVILCHWPSNKARPYVVWDYYPDTGVEKGEYWATLEEADRCFEARV